MKKLVAIAGLLGVLCGPGLADRTIFLHAPRDDPNARRGVTTSPELERLRDTYRDMIRTRLQALTLDDARRVFGAKFEIAANPPDFGLVDGDRPAGPPVDHDQPSPVLPLFAGRAIVMSGAGSIEPARQPHHDLHAIGNLGYVGLFYAGNGERVNNAVIYFRADDTFVPLKSTNDFARRLAWEKARFGALRQWIEEHIPVTELGVVRISEGSQSRFDLGANVCVVRGPKWAAGVRHNENTNMVWILKETTNVEERRKSREIRRIDHPGESVSFSFDGKIYRLTPEFVNPAHEPQ